MSQLWDICPYPDPGGGLDPSGEMGRLWDILLRCHVG